MSDPNGWQDIATAPKDGSLFLAYGSYAHPDGKTVTEYADIIQYSGNEHVPWSNSTGSRAGKLTDFSHWQPLPGPPDPDYWERRQALKERREIE